MTGALETLKDLSPILSLLVVGAFAFASLFDGGLKKRRQEADQLDEKLIKNLKETVQQMQQELTTLKVSREHDLDRIKKLEAENILLTKVLQGRGDDQLAYQKQAMEAMENTKTILKISQATNERMGELYKLLEGHMQRTEEIISVALGKEK